MTVKERLIEYLDFKHISKSDFGRTIGVSSAYVSSIRKSIDDEKVLRISEKYSDLNIDWLLYGKGSMLKSEGVPVKSFTQGVPYYNVDFLGGFDLLPDDQTTRPEYLIDFKAYDRATCWCNISGHSMEPEISNGDIIALREVPDPTFLPFGEVYAIVTTTGMRTVKRIGPGKDSETYSLIPANKSPEFGVQEIPKSMVAKVFEVLGCMKKL